MGMTPLLETKPSVGFSPTIPHVADGQRIEPSVSVPTAIAARLAAIAAPEPELEPHGFLSKIYGFFVCPPRADQPLEDFVERNYNVKAGNARRDGRRLFELTNYAAKKELAFV